MSLRFPTATDKLAVLEKLLEREKREGDAWNASILSATCRDLRLEAPAKKNEAADAIERHVLAVLRSKTALGYDHHLLAGLAQEFIGRWPLVKKALTEPATVWKPIESAPKDRLIYVLIKQPWGREVRPRKWSSDDTYWWYGIVEDGAEWRESATHWCNEEDLPQ